MGTSSIERKSRVNVRLSEEMYQRAEAIAHDYGVPVSTLAALAIGQFVSTNETTIKARENMLNSMGGDVAATFKDMFEQLAQD